MNDDTDLDLTRFLRALVHGRLWILAAAIAGLLVGVFLGLSSPSAQASITLQPNHKDLVEADLKVELDTNSMLQLTASDLASKSFATKLEKQVGSKVTVSPVLDTEAGNIRVLVEGDGEQDATSAANMMIVEAQTRYAAEFSRPAGESLTRLNSLLEAATTRRTEIETRLQQVEPGPLADGLILDLEQQSTQVSKVQASASLLTTIVDDAFNELQATSVETSNTHKIILYPIALALAAALLCAGVLVTKAGFDRKVRTRRDLDRLGIHSLIGSLPVSHDATDVAIVAAAIAATSDDLASQIVPVKSTPRTAEAIAAIALEMNTENKPDSVKVMPGLDVDPAAVVSAQSTNVTTLVVDWGAVKAETVVQRVNQLSAAGAKQVCIVLVGAPDRLVSDYER